jgi:hypothetical protein
MLNDILGNVVYGKVSSTNSDGFEFDWTEIFGSVAGDNYYVIAFCIK